MVLKSQELKVLNLTKEVKFDLIYQKSFLNKAAHLIIKLHRKKLILISITVLEIKELKVFNLTSEVKLPSEVMNMT